MNILLVSSAVEGGAGIACLRLFHALRRSGQNVKLLHLEGRASSDPDIVSFYPSVRDLFMRQVKSFPFKTVRHLLIGDYQCQYRLPSSIHRLERHPLVDWADVINLHWVPDFLDYRKFFHRVGRKSVVWTMHDWLPFAGGYHYESELPQSRNRQVEQRIAGVKRAAIQDSNLVVVAPSKWLLGLSKQYATFSGCPHRHIFNGLPLDIYKPIDKRVARSILNLPQDRKIVFFTAQSLNSTRKGSRHLVTALVEHLDTDVLLVSVGRKQIQSDLGVNYRHLGYFADDLSMSLCYSSADVVAVPSVEDNSPNIIIESLACGRPVVAFKVGGIGELVNGPELGVSVEEVSAAALAAGIDTVLASESDSNRIRKDATERFGYDDLASNYTKLFAELTDQ